MNNETLLIIKPEIVSRYQEVIEEIQKRGYTLRNIFSRDDFNQVVYKIYAKDFSKDILEGFSKAYKENNFGNVYYVVFLESANGNSIQQLKDDVGDFEDSIYRKNLSLRSLFGLYKIYKVSDNFNVIFNGFHKVDNIEDLNYHLDIFGFPKE